MLARARAVTLMNYHEVARHVGIDPYVMLGRAGLHPSALRDPENWIPAKRILSLLSDSAARSGRDDFGVLIGECRSFASLGPVSLLLKHDVDLRGVIGDVIEYRRLLNDLLHFELREDGHSAVLEWALVPGLQSTQGVNLLATIAYRALVDSGEFNWQPECIHFRQATPRHVATFKRVFRCSLEFGSNFDGMSFSSACLDFSNNFADAALAAHARKLLSLMPAIRRNDTTVDRARSTIPFLISKGQAQADDVAKCLGVSVRTLQRGLIGEGQSFSSLLNEVRRELVVRYLSNSSQSITDVAHLIGYSSLSSFTRWFVSEFGMSPGRWRQQMRNRDALHLQIPPQEAGQAAQLSVV